MKKKRISQQQLARIKKNQAAYHEPSQPESNSCHNGLILSRFNRHAEVEYAENKKILCAIRSNIDSLVAGDRVIWQETQAHNQETGVILSRCPRDSLLARQDKDQKAIAANLSQILIVVAPKPEPNWLLLDSYLIMAELLDLKASIVLNKIDIPCSALQRELVNQYQSLGYELLFTSQNSLNGYEQLKASLREETSVFVGQSGVGKSSLVSNLLGITIETTPLSLNTELGCHTTSSSRLYHLAEGGDLIDSPGLRAFTFAKMNASDLIYGFREFRDLAKQCKFRNCQHQELRNCALLQALDQGLVSQRRYKNLLFLLTN